MESFQCVLKYLNKHEVVNANEGKKLYKCSICEKTFERKVVYDQHFTSVHKRKRIVGIKNSFNNKEKKLSNKRKKKNSYHDSKYKPYVFNISDVDSTPFDCIPPNDNSTQAKKQFMEYVQMVYEGKKPFECPKCDAKFMKEELYTQHLANEHGPPYKPDQNSINKLMTEKLTPVEENSVNLDQDDINPSLLFDHSEHKVFKCEICSVSFAQKCHLNRHIMTKHEGKIPNSKSLYLENDENKSPKGKLNRHSFPQSPKERPLKFRLRGNKVPQRENLKNDAKKSNFFKCDNFDLDDMNSMDMRDMIFQLSNDIAKEKSEKLSSITEDSLTFTCKKPTDFSSNSKKKSKEVSLMCDRKLKELSPYNNKTSKDLFINPHIFTNFASDEDSKQSSAPHMSLEEHNTAKKLDFLDSSDKEPKVKKSKQISSNKLNKILSKAKEFSEIVKDADPNQKRKSKVRKIINSAVKLYQKEAKLISQNPSQKKILDFFTQTTRVSKQARRHGL